MIIIWIMIQKCTAHSAKERRDEKELGWMAHIRSDDTYECDTQMHSPYRHQQFSARGVRASKWVVTQKLFLNPGPVEVEMEYSLVDGDWSI